VTRPSAGMSNTARPECGPGAEDSCLWGRAQETQGPGLLPLDTEAFSLCPAGVVAEELVGGTFLRGSRPAILLGISPHWSHPPCSSSSPLSGQPGGSLLFQGLYIVICKIRQSSSHS
jgi:hypothetical protein